MIAIIDYRAGNVASVKNALDRLGVASLVTADPAEVLAADGVIFPGQGRAGAAMKELKRTGLDQAIPRVTKPFLGICLGMQLLAEFSEEDSVNCLGIIPGRCRKFPGTVKAPQLGWNKVSFKPASPLTKEFKDGEYFYFVHSYYSDVGRTFVTGTTDYGFEFASMLQKGNFYAVQFHPEKSGSAGQQLLKNFCEVSKCL
ncbi:MAG TPA: imidazole glycerol phosphate synthase subunit HisH [Candidatus Dormibacteraeota bacterium]|nr:imidazole glycerol phosphate synthase subunit HisH [Candidatus Dormibacteraeota bacterium]